ncbi:type II toxin-antitoxin system VapC family toxin [Fodinicola feengrottensis]|uniref:Ribonuclease VapC n=1 Tax=Fodinicola feengrottensis TaxID=435914 RepID=A0ABN2FVI1_9ACTN|nr:type II toxin-antitoxin system VapC family toxin [Fodinicola feengrottensis]
MIYLDSSAVVKLARQENETAALRSWLAANPHPLVCSALARTETARALRRNDQAALKILPNVLALLLQRPITGAILDAAGQLPGTTLRSLDAIHLATAEDLKPALTHFIAYDKRLADAARSLGLHVVVPE